MSTQQPINFALTFPQKKVFKIVETSTMRTVMERTLAVHVLSALVVWYGRSRLGKTTTALLMVDKLAAIYDPNNPDAFRAVHYEVGGVEAHSGNEVKRGIKSLYNAALSTRLDDAVYVRDPPESLAARLVHGLRLRNIQMIFVDEAGLLSLNAIRGMVLVRDVAENMGWPLTIIFIGMDDLPVKMTKLPQIENRVHEWCFFEEYDLDSTWGMLAELHPHFISLNRDDEAHQKQISFIHQTYGGIPGLIVPFLQRLDHEVNKLRAANVPFEVDLQLLRATHLRTARAKRKSISQSQEEYGSKSALQESSPIVTSTKSRTAEHSVKGENRKGTR
jgi:hypothetical protein